MEILKELLSETFSTYYGTDIAAAFCGIIAMYHLERKRREGFAWNVIGTCLGIVFAAQARSVTFVFTNSFVLFLNIRAYRQWEKSKDAQMTENAQSYTAPIIKEKLSLKWWWPLSKARDILKLQ